LCFDLHCTSLNLTCSQLGRGDYVSAEGAPLSVVASRRHMTGALFKRAVRVVLDINTSKDK